MEHKNPVEPASQAKWGALTAVIITIGIYFASQILAGILVSLYPLARHWNSAQATKWLEQSVIGQFAFVFVAEAITLWILWMYLKRRHAKPADIGLKKPQAKDAGYALAGFGVYFVVYILAIQLIHTLIPGLNLDQKQDLGFTASAGGLLWLVFISLVILPPITEEILARGFLYTGLRSQMTKINAAIVTSILFASAHLQAGSGHPLLWVAAIDTFTLSLVLVYLREKTDSLWASIFIHMIKNAIAFAALFIFKI